MLEGQVETSGVAVQNAKGSEEGWGGSMGSEARDVVAERGEKRKGRRRRRRKICEKKEGMGRLTLERTPESHYYGWVVGGGGGGPGGGFLCTWARGGWGFFFFLCAVFFYKRTGVW